MSNNTKSTRSTQQRTNRYNEIANAQQEWHKNNDRLFKDKKDLGYENVSWEAFLGMSAEAMSIEAEQRLLIIDLQEQ